MRKIKENPILNSWINTQTGSIFSLLLKERIVRIRFNVKQTDTIIKNFYT